MCPHGEWKSFHRFQHMYAWFFYGLMTLVWVLFKDFGRILKYQREGMVKKQKANIVTEWVILILTKVIYVTYIFVIPTLILSVAWWQVLLGVITMHYIAGFI